MNKTLKRLISNAVAICLFFTSVFSGVAFTYADEVSLAEETVTGAPEDAVYDGYDIVVDGRISASNPSREGQPIYKTVREAVTAAGEGGTEEKPFVIGIVPGVYREHIRVNAPWITFKKITNSTSAEEDAKLTWYWGTNYTYDNVGADGDVDTSNPNTQEKGNPYADKMPGWGRSTWIQKGATGFRAEDIYFENSFNLYVTEEELAVNVRVNQNTGDVAKGYTYPERNVLSPGTGDGSQIEVTYSPGGKTAKLRNDVRAKAWRERCCALFTEADKAVFVNCKVVATQDTIGTGGRAYFKDCYLAGTVDFICGGGQMLFDNCNIHWESSPYTGDGDGGGALTAASTAAYPANGYLFYNCRVTGNDTTEQVNFGRPWGAQNTETVWVNTISEISKVNNKAHLEGSGWGGMGCEPEDARGYFEYNTKDINGKAIDTSTRRGTTNERFKRGLLDEYTVVKYNPYRYTAFKNALAESFDGWDPAGVVDKWKTIEQEAVVTINDSYTENFKLPDAPAGYEVSYYVDSKYAEIAEDGKTVNVTRPIYGQGDKEVKFTAYIKKAGTIDGVERELSTVIKQVETPAGTFDLKGKITTNIAPSEDITVSLEPVQTSGFKPLTEPVTAVIKANSEETEYTIPYLPAAEYNLQIKLDSDKFAVKNGDVKKFTGEVDTPYTLDIEIGKLTTVSKKANDAIGTPASGYTFEKINDAEKGEVYHYKRPQSGTNTKQQFYWDFASIAKASNLEGIEEADQVRVSFSMKANAMGKETNVIDLIGAEPKAYANAGDEERYLRMQIDSWQQLNILKYTVGNRSGASNNETQFLNLFEGEGGGKFTNSGNTGWNDVTVIINFKDNKVTIDSPQGKKGNVPYTFTGLPSKADITKLKMMFYPQGKNTDSDTDEIYISAPTIAFEKFIEAEDTANGVNVAGKVSKGITGIELINVDMPEYTHKATIVNVYDDRGDVDGNGVFDMNDASVLLDYVLNKENYSGTLESPERIKYMGDVDGDDILTAKDVSEIVAKVLNSSYEFSGVKPGEPEPGAGSTFTFKNKINPGKYEISYTTDGIAQLKEIKGASVSFEDGKYYLTVSEKTDISDIEVIAEYTAGSSAGETAVKSMFDKYAEYKKDVTVTLDGQEKTIGVYQLKEALYPVNVTGFEISIDSSENGCVNTDGSLIILKKNSDEHKAFMASHPDGYGFVNYKIKNLAEDKEYTVTYGVYPIVVDNVLKYENFEDKAIGSTISNNGFTANIVKYAGKGNVFEFANNSGGFNDKIDVSVFEGMTAGKTYAISYDFMKDNVSDNGWRLQLGLFADFLYDGNNMNISSTGNVQGCGPVEGSKPLIENGEAGKWYRATYVCDTETGNIDAYINGTYVSSYKGVEGTLPDKLLINTYYAPTAKIYIDDIVVEEFPSKADIEADFNETMIDVEIPESITLAVSKEVPTVTANGLDIKWTTDSANLVTITEGIGKATIDFSKATAELSVKLIATVKKSMPFEGHARQGYDITFVKEYTIAYVPSGDTPVAKFDLTINSSSADAGLKATILKGTDEVVPETAVGTTLTSNIDGGAYTVKFTVNSGYTISSVKIGENELTANTDGSYTINLGADTIITVTAKAATDFTAAEKAIADTLKGVGSYDDATKVYTIDKAFDMPTEEGYTFAINTNDAVNANGTLKRGAYGSTATAKDVTFVITHTDTGDTENYEVKILVPEKKSDVIEEDFEGLAKDSAFKGGTIVSSADRGRYVKFDQAKNGKDIDVVVIDKYSLEEGKVYEISFDMMRIADTTANPNTLASNSSVGWNISFTGDNHSQHFGYIANKFKVRNGKYSSDPNYGTTKEDIITDCASENWYNVKFIVDTINKNIDVVTEDGYKTSTKYNDALPKLLKLQSEYASRGDKDYLCLDNIRIKTINTDFSSDLDTAMAGVNIPTTEIDSDTTLTLPTTADGKTIEWATDKANAIEIGTNGNVTLKKQDIGTTAKLIATVKSSEYTDIYNGSTVPYPVIYKKEYTVKFATTKTDFFTVSGNITFDFAPETDVDVKVEINKGENVVKEEIVTIGSGNTTGNYSIEGIPSGETYDVNISTNNESYKPKNADALTVTGNTGDTKSLNIAVGQLIDKVYKINFDNASDIGTIINNGSNVFKAELATDPADSSQNVLKLTSTGDSGNAGIYWNLGELVSDLADSDQVTVSYKMKANVSSYEKPIVDIASGLTNEVKSQPGTSTNDNIFVRANYGDQHQQINYRDKNANFYLGYGDGKFNASDNNVNGYTKWYTSDLTIDYANKNMKGQVQLEGSKASTIDTETDAYPNAWNWGGTHHPFPTEADRSNLTLAFYPYQKAIEYYMDDITVSYKKFRTADDDVQTYSVRGSIDNNGALSRLKIVNTDDNSEYSCAIASTSFSVSDVPVGNYKVVATTNDGYSIKAINGTSGNDYSFAVSADITDLNITTEYEAEGGGGIIMSLNSIDDENTSADKENENITENADTDENSDTVDLDDSDNEPKEEIVETDNSDVNESNADEQITDDANADDTNTDESVADEQENEPAVE